MGIMSAINQSLGFQTFSCLVVVDYNVLNVL